jgi:hypothetical protein
MTGTDERLGTAGHTVGEPSTSGDDHLAGELARVVALADPVPPEWAAAARAAFAWRAIAGAEARLDYDAEVVAGSGKGGPPPDLARRQLRYTSGARAVELDVDTGADKVRLVGRLVPAGQAEVVVHWPGGQRSTTCDAAGGFGVDDLPTRPLCLLVAGDEPFKTGWFVP